MESLDRFDEVVDAVDDDEDAEEIEEAEDDDDEEEDKDVDFTLSFSAVVEVVVSSRKEELLE